MEGRSRSRGRGRQPTLSSGPEPGRRRRREVAAAAAAVAEQASRARAPAPDEPSSPKRKQFFLASRYYDENVTGESLLTISRDHCNFLVLEHLDKDNVSLLDKGEMSELSFSGSPPASLDRAPYQLSELSNIADYALLNDTYSIHISDSDSKLKEHLSYLSSETDLEMQKEEQFFDMLKDESKNSNVLDDICRNLDSDCKDISSSDIEKCDLDEDSQQEYHSAEEQDYSGYHLDFDQIKTLCTPNSEVIELGNSDYEINANGLGQNHVKKLEESTFFSYETTHIHTQEDVAEAPKRHDYLSLTEHHGQKYWRCQEQEASFTNQSLLDGVTRLSNTEDGQDVALGHAAPSRSGPEKVPKTLKAGISSNRRRSPRTEKKDVCAEVGENSLLKGMEKPALFLERASAASRQPGKCFQSSAAYVFDESDVSAYDQSCYKFVQSTAKPDLDFPMTLPKVPAKESHLAEGDSLPEAARAGVLNKTHFISVESKHPQHSGAANRDCLVTVNQTIDASSDFRACFTTSRATSARSSVASRSSNTEITMMNKMRPSEWAPEKQKSIACNTDWSSLQDWAGEEGHLPGPAPRGLDKALPAENSKANDDLFIKDYLELKNKYDMKDLKKNSESQFQPSKEVEKNFSPKCCQKTLQRAIKAELQLLRAHYQMCHQHCWKIYRLIMEEKESFTRNCASDFAKTELESTLLSLFGDLKFKYLSMREKIIKGIPLDELPPLSVESKLSSFFSTFNPSKIIKEDSHILSAPNSSPDVPAAHSADLGAAHLKGTLSQTLHTSENVHPKQEAASKNDSRKTRDLNVGFRNLKLDDENYPKRQEKSEGKENLMGTKCLEILNPQMEPEQRSSEVTAEKKISEPPHREPNKSYLIHVGSLGPSVSEKYQVSEVSICTSSHNYRYASLVFKKANKAKMAVEEMNGKEINGKSVNVRLVKTPIENVPPLSFRNESRLALGGSEKTLDSKGSSSAPLTSKISAHVLRPPAPEQESVSLSADQKSGKKGLKQNKPVKLLPETPLPYIPPNILNLGSFTKLLRKLEALHPDISRDTIIDALQEVRTNNKGFLSGLSLTTIVEMTTSVLRNSAFKKEEKKYREEIFKVGIH
ncbi:RNA-binding protein 44 isoform X2 [Sarcophilus harrisii]|uniref:RNA-binding protein 44 isoform X2 n=1 Tax=Sarcophilus harrisii TaxID=9305 RepID=UPI001301B0F0|nr:RNA-binding protein 44 isoform X2 [Sarcophilus harrisii]